MRRPVRLTPVIALIIVLGAVGGARASSAGDTASPPGEPPAGGQLSGVWCTSASNCVAVGETDGAAFSTSLAEQWSGRGWTTMHTPLRNNDTGLSAVACPRPDLCQAAGSAGLEIWNGTSWAAETTPPSRRAPNFTSVSCTTATFCLAVGQRGFHTRALTLAESWNGSTWSAHNPVNPAAAATAILSSVSCVSPSDCLAVGYYEDSGNNLFALAESWNGSSWTLLTPPAGDTLSSVACFGAGTCIVLGDTSAAALALSWNGTAWQVLPAPPGSPSAIWCGTASDCMTVGGAGAASWNGSSWTSLSVPNPSAALSSVSCVSASACMAVGTGTGNFSFSASWDGSRWTAHRVSQRDESAGVWCPRASRCQAVGGYLTPSDDQATLATAWNGSSWRQRPAAAPLDATLEDVSCVSATRCMAVGAADGAMTLAERWNGRTWRVTPTPNLRAGSYEYGVSCRGDHCLAVGRDLTAQWWNGSRWRVVKVSLPRKSYSGELTDVSCATSAYCLVTGFDYPSAESNSSSFAGLWNGRKFRLLTAPGGGLNTVSCVSTSFCLAVTSTAAEIWNGRAWRTGARLRGSSGYGPGITAVSCATRSACMAVGNYLTGGGPQGVQGFNAAEWWNGSSWRRLSPAGAGGGLADVSCTSPTSCMAVGLVQTALVSEHTLAERWNGTRWQLLATPNP